MNAYKEAPWLIAVARVFANTPIYAVGGAVRNPLMGLPMSDIDLCGPARPEEVMALCENTPVHAYLRAAHFGTVELHVTDEDGKRHMAEYTTFREDSYRCGHRPDAVRFANSIEVDCLRRDFSVNAMYRRLLTDDFGEVIDPTGGLDHLKKGILHTVTQDPDHVLGDDGLRILRAVRFEAELGLMPTASLLASLQKNAHLLSDIAPERLRDEWQKIIMADFRYPSIQRKQGATFCGLHTLHTCDAWQYVAGAMPYEEDCVEALARLEVPNGLPLFPARMAMLLLHADPSDLSHCVHLCFAKKDVTLASLLIACTQACESQTLTLFEGAQFGRDALRFACASLEALHSPSLDFAKKMDDRLQTRPCHLKELSINGHDLLPLLKKHQRAPKEMSALLHTLWEHVVNDQVANERTDLLQYVEDLLDRFPVF